VASNTLPLVLAGVGPLAGGAAVYLLGWRASRGRIGTSNADVIWQAAESIRHDLTDAYKAQGLELAAVKAELATVNAQLAAIRGRLDR